MKWVWKCRDCKSEYPEDKEDLPKYTNPSGIEGVICPCGGMLDLCPTPRAVGRLKSAAAFQAVESYDNTNGKEELRIKVIFQKEEYEITL